MPPAPLVAAILLAVSAALGSIGLALESDPFSAGSALLVAAGGGILTIVTVAGVLLARSRWSRWMATAIAALWFTVALLGPLGPVPIATLIAAAASAAVATGPWLTRWLRRLETANGPPPAAVFLLLLLLATPVTIGLFVGSEDPAVSAWLLSAWAAAVALALARVSLPALWIARFAHLPAVVAGAVFLTNPASLLVAAKGALETALLWRRDLHLAVAPLVPGRAVPIPPELIDPTIMRAAGLDDRGLPLEDS